MTQDRFGQGQASPDRPRAGSSLRAAHRAASMFDDGRAPRERAGEPDERAAAHTAVDVAHWLRQVRRSWLMVGACGVVATALALFALTLLPPAYVARVQILVDPTDLRVVDNDVTPRSPLADSGVSVAESQVRVIGSDSVLRRVIEKLDLDHDPEFAKPFAAGDGPFEAIKSWLGIGTPANLPRDPVLRALDELRSAISVRRAERTFVIDVTAKARDGHKAALIANAISDAFFIEETSARTNSAARASENLASRLSELRSSLQTAEEKLARFREDNKLVATSGRLLSDQQLGDLNGQLTSASIRTADARARSEQARQIRDSAGTALPEMLQSTEMRALRQQLADLSRTTAEMGTRLGPRHPMVSEQSAQIRDLERSIAREKTRIIDSTNRELDRAVASEAAIRKELDRVKSETTVNDRALIGQRELERGVETARAIYETFLRRARETGQQERLDTTNMRVISAATPPLGRTWPPSPKLVLPAALLLGLLAGAALAVLRGTKEEDGTTHADGVVAMPHRA